jgi:Immunoglobulin V-set domain
MLINFDCYHFFSSTVPLFHTEAVVGSEARLPCNLTSPITGDRVSLVIWYKEGQSTPIYSFDVRHTEQLDKGSHHEAGNGSLNGRSHFNTTLLPSFVITNVKGQDNGLYRCRVDFVKSPTRNIKIQLSVIGKDFNFLLRITSGKFKLCLPFFSSLFSFILQFHLKMSSF